MATNPYFTQLHTQRFSFIGSPQQRDGTYLKDQRFLNMYPELIKSNLTDGKKYYLKKRPGVSPWMSFASGEGRGIFYWAGVYWTAVGSQLYRNNTSVLTMTTSTGIVGFAEFRSDAEDVLFFCDGVHGWIVNGNGTNIQITDANFPNPHVATPIFLDGYIFLAKPGTQQILNSALQDPTTWPTDGFIDAEMYPDNIVALNKQQNYLVVVGNNSVEFFYDNANATGSPLQRNAPAVAQLGCPAPITINQTEKELILVGSTSSGGRTVWLIEGFQPTEIGTEPIREALDLEGLQIINASALTVQCAGHKWYILNLVGFQRTFVYDFEEKMWHEWTTGTDQEVFGWKFASDSANGFPILLSYNTGVTGSLSPQNFQDFGAPINCVVTTSKIDFDTIMRKRFFRLSLTTDSPNGTTDVFMTVDWSDDDYTTWVGGKQLDLGVEYPTITQLGYGRRRAFRFTYTAAQPLRMESFELNVTQEVRR